MTKKDNVKYVLSERRRMTAEESETNYTPEWKKTRELTDYPYAVKLIKEFGDPKKVYMIEWTTKRHNEKWVYHPADKFWYRTAYRASRDPKVQPVMCCQEEEDP